MKHPEWPAIDPNDYEDVEIDDEDNPELTQEDFAAARPLKEVAPEVWAALTGEPSPAPARDVTLTLDPKVVDFFQSQGPDWRERMRDALTAAAG